MLVDRLRSDEYTGLVTLELSPLALGLLKPGATRATLCQCRGVRARQSSAESPWHNFRIHEVKECQPGLPGRHCRAS